MERTFPLLSGLNPLLLALLAIGLSPDLHAQWTKLGPNPAAADFTGGYFFDAQHGWITGNNRNLMETTDGGKTWAQTPSISVIPGSALHGVEFVGPQNGWALGNTSWRTQDGGASWQAMPNVPPGTVSHFDFVSAQDGWIA